MFIKFIIKLYQVIADYFLNNSGCKFKWGGGDKTVKTRDRSVG